MFSTKYVKTLKPYPLVSHKAWELQNNEDVLKLDWNEATIAPSPKVKENIRKFLENGKMHWYPDVNNSLLLEEISKYNVIPIDNIQYFASSDSLHEYIFRAYIYPHDKVLIVSPTYDNIRAVVQSNGAITEFYYLDDKFKLGADNFASYLKIHNPKIVYICNPNNPTGTIYQKEFIEKLIKTYGNILFIVDEAYYEFTGISCKELVHDYNNIIISRTFSKAFALASFRVGYTITSKNNVQILSKIRNPKNISTFSQLAAISVLQDIEYMQRYVKEVKEAKIYFDNELRRDGIQVTGNAGNFSLLNLDYTIKRDFINYMGANNVFIRNFEHLEGMKNYLRITIGTKEQMEKVLHIIRKYFKP